MSGLLGVDLEKAPATARAWGFDGIEISAGGGEDELKRWADPAYRRHLAEVAAKENCALRSICIGTLNDGNIGNKDESLRKRAERILALMIEAAGDLGVKILLVPFFGKADLAGPDTRIQNVIDGIKPFADQADKAGVILALETTIPAPDLLTVHKKINHPAVKFYYDMANMVWQGCNPATEIRLLGSAIAQVHIKDNVFDTGGWGGFSLVPLGEGRVDFAAGAMALRAIQYNGWLVLETAVRDGDCRRSAITQLEFTRQHFE